MRHEPFESLDDAMEDIRFIGIDFGTYKCAMSGFDTQKQEAKIVRNAEGEETTRSLVYYGEEEEILVGILAQNKLDDPEQCKNVVSSVKRHLAKRFHYPMPNEPTPIQVATEIFRKLKHDADRHYHMEVTHAVVTYPVTFTPGERDILLEATKKAGFQEVQLLKEPEAAARAFIQEGYRPGNCVLVYDLGAGTFDLALLVRDPMDGVYRAEMKADSDGYWCGGDDFDRALYDYWDQLFSKQYKRRIALTGDTDQKFLNECRKRKELLSSQLRGTFSSMVLDPEQKYIQFKHTIDVATFEGLIHSQIEETVERTLVFFKRAQASGYTPDTVVLIGGSSQIPLVKRLLQKSLPLEPQHWDKWKLAVALGATYHANDLWGNQKQIKQYWLSVEDAKLEGIWNGQVLTRFTSLAQELGLVDAKKEWIEREVLGSTIREIVGSPQWIFTPTVLVSQDMLGQFTTIGEAIQKSPPNTTILVQQGRYTEQLVIDKPFEIIGMSSREDIIVESTEGACILMKTDTATVSNLTLCGHTGIKGSRYLAVDIPQGQLVLNNCNITSDSLSCVGIYGATANPIIRKCNIHSGEQCGILIYDGGKGTVENCDISGNTSAGIRIEKGSNPIIRQCRIRNGKGEGICIDDRGEGTVENCEIFGNAQAGVRITRGSNPTVKNCDIFDNGKSGDYPGILIKTGSNPVIRECKIHDAQQSNGIWIKENGRGMIEECDIFGNNDPNVGITTGSTPKIQRCKIHTGKKSGVGVWDHGQGIIEDCEIFSNAGAGISISESTNTIIRGCMIEQGGTKAVEVYEQSIVIVESCDTLGTWTIAVDSQQISKDSALYREIVLEILRRFYPMNDFYVFPNIPEGKLINAKSVCNIPNGEKVLGLIDCTLLGSAKDCVLFGTEAIYYHNSLHLEERISYAKFSSHGFKKVPSDPFNEEIQVTDIGWEIKIGRSAVSAKTLCKILDDIKHALT